MSVGCQQQDGDGVWRQAIPLPFYGARWTWRGLRDVFICTECKPPAKFATERAYRDHYRSDHPGVVSNPDPQP